MHMEKVVHWSAPSRDDSTRWRGLIPPRLVVPLIVCRLMPIIIPNFPLPSLPAIAPTHSAHVTYCNMYRPRTDRIPRTHTPPRRQTPLQTYGGQPADLAIAESGRFILQRPMPDNLHSATPLISSLPESTRIMTYLITNSKNSKRPPVAHSIFFCFNL